MTTSLLNNRYQSIKLLGSGGFGETFLAEDTYLPSRRPCAIKQLKPIITDPELYETIQQRFQREAATLEALSAGCDQIPKLYAYFSENGEFYLIQEWIEGETLTSKVAAEGALSETAVRKILTSLLKVLHYVHSKGIIYRDIKPDNIILRRADCEPVLIDFGAVKETMATAIAAPGKSIYTMVLGTPGFMAPEQAVGRPIYASDIYSLGMTAIYLLTGKFPQEFQVDPRTEQVLWQQYATDVSPDLVAVLNKAIEYQPRDRYSTAIKMLHDLQSIDTISLPQELDRANVPTQQQTLVTQTLPPPTIRRSPSQGKRQKYFVFSGLLIGGLLSAAAVVSLVPQPTPRSFVTSVTPPTPVSAEIPTERSPQLPVSAESPVVARSPQPPLTKRATDRDSPASPVAARSPQPPLKRGAEQPSPQPPTGAEPASPQSSLQPPTGAEPASPQSSPQPPFLRGARGDLRDLPGFPVGTAESAIKAALGNPTKTSRGLWINTRAAIYEIEPERITLGYLFDRTSGRLRQTEVSFAQSVAPETMQATLQQMLGEQVTDEITQGWRRVYQRRVNRYSFRQGELKGAIERNSRDRIYIGIWDANLH